MRNFKLSHAAVGRVIFVIAIAILALSAGWPRFVQSWAQGTPNRAGLVIRHNDGRVTTQCVSFPEETISGYDLLVASGLDLNIAADSVGTSICRLDGEGCTFPQDQCFCQCTSQPCLYWSYWRQTGGQSDWVYSPLGASYTEVRDGDVEGWVWGEGSIGSPSDSQPPAITFDDICNPQTPTPEPTPTDTPTVTPTFTPTQTPTSTPTPTNTPIPLPVITFFAPDRNEITVGDSVILRWETSGADAVVLRKPDGEQTLGTSGSLTLTPATTVVYELIARNAAGEDRIQTTVTVQAPAQPPAPATPLPTMPETATSPAASPTVAGSGPAPVETSPTAVPQPTPTLTPILVPPPPASATPLLVVTTAAPTETPTLAVIVIAGPAATTPPPTETPTNAPTETPTETPTSTPTSTPAPVAVNALEGSTAALADDAAAASAGSTNTEMTGLEMGDAGAAGESEQATEASQLLPIFTGMAFILGVPLLLGMAWLGYQSWRRRAP